MRYYYFIFISILIFSLSVFSESEWAGAFMRVGIDPSVMAMGFSGVTFAPSSTSSYWNPSILGFSKGVSISSSMTKLSMDRRLYYGLVSVSLGGSAGFGGGWLRGEVVNIDLRDYDGDKYGSFDYPQDAFLFSFGRSFGSIFGVGLTYIQHHYNLNRIHANGSQLNIGFLTNYRGFRAGLAIDNLYSKLDWDVASSFSVGRNEKFPLRVRIGSGVNVYDERITVVGEMWLINSIRKSFHLGAEVRVSDDIVLRGGINNGDVTIGGGCKFQLSHGSILIDYSYIQDSLGISPGNSISLSYIF